MELKFILDSFPDPSPLRPPEMKNSEGNGLADGVVRLCITGTCTMQSIDRFAAACGKLHLATWPKLSMRAL